jgi:hypothetical protein
MDKELSLGQQKIKFDRAATVGLYRNSVAGADECKCLYCKNFAAQRSSVYPSDFLALLEQLGADPLKELEAFEYSMEKGRSLYGGWFAFSGELIEGAKRVPSHRNSTIGLQTTFPMPGFLRM